MANERADIDFGELLEGGANNPKAILFDIFSQGETQEDFLKFLETQIKRGRARKVADFIASNSFESIFPQLLQPLAKAYEKTGQKEKAADVLLRMLQLNPESPELNYELSRIFFDAGKLSEAEKHLMKVTESANDFADAHFLLGNIYRMRNKFHAAAERYLTALGKGCGNAAVVFYNLGVVFEKMFDYEKALRFYEKAIEQNPRFADAHWNRALLLLRKKDYAAAWQEFEWRASKRDFEIKYANIPDCKKGENLSVKNVLFYDEQGFGDAIQFLRFAEEVSSAGKIAIVRKELKRLFSAAGIFDKVFAREETDNLQCDCKISLLSLPYFLSKKNVSLKKPLWNFNAGNKSGAKKIGFVWKGNPEHENDKMRSVPLEDFLKIFEGIDAALFSLQIGEITEQEKLILRQSGVTNLAQNIVDFYDTAQALAQLDAVVSVDTAIVHLAGSMFVPAFVLLPKNSDWRWGESDEERNDWYETVKTFRQKELGDWDAPFLKLQNELKAFIAKSKTTLQDEKEIFRKAEIYARKNEHEKSLSILLEAYNSGVSSHEMIFNIALAYHKAGKLDEAETFYSKLEYLKDENVFYHLLLLYLQQNAFDKFERLFPEALDLFPKSARINFLVGNYFKAKENFEKAEEYFLKTLELDGNFANAKINLASVYYIVGKVNEAEKIYAELLRGNPDNADLHYNLALIFQEKNNYDAALRELNIALSKKDDARFHLAKAEVLLAQKEFQSGLREYEYRLKINPPLFPVKYPASPGDAKNKRILVFEEQGIGDTLQFIRFIPMLFPESEVDFACRNSLLPLLEKQRGFRAVSFDEAGKRNYDYSIPVVSLFSIYFENYKTLPVFEKYLSAEETTLQNSQRKKIAIAWRGNPNPPHQRKRHFDVKLLEKTFRLTDADFYPLQNNLTDEERIFLSRFENVIYTENNFRDFNSLAALINSVDSVVTVDTVYAHLAGALGKETVLLLHYSPDWRWLAEGDKTDWYPAMKLLRQKQYGDWRSVTENDLPALLR